MKILIPVDGSAAGAAAVAFIAGRASSMRTPPTVELMTVVPADARTLPAEADRSAAAVLDPAEDALAIAGLVAKIHHEAGEPGAAIAARADAIDADLVVMGSRGLGPLGELVLGSVAQATLAACHRPVLVVRDSAHAHRHGLRVGVAIDGSAASLATVGAAIHLAELFGSGGAITLIHAEGPPPHLIDSLLGVAERETAYPTPASQERLVAARAMTARAGVPTREVVLRGWPDEELPRYARENLDVLGIGSSARSSLSRFVLGSVASRVTARCDIPLLLARAH